ncbi:MAG: DUF4065 domain-containing protein [Spirochaetes bacterium]|nr:DUF4065 domain-containing protein [Spirochaetota bacterium]
MYNPIYVSNNFLTRSFDQKTPVTAMKIQKMLYFLYRDYLKETGVSLFSERFSAWKYGPVLESVYHTYKRFGANSITDYGGTPAYSIKEEGDDGLLEKLLDKIWGISKPYNGIYLSQLTHQKESAWYKAWMAEQPFLNDDDISSDSVELK